MYDSEKITQRCYYIQKTECCSTVSKTIWDLKEEKNIWPQYILV